jgi:hypothetical protein
VLSHHSAEHTKLPHEFEKALVEFCRYVCKEQWKFGFKGSSLRKEGKEGIKLKLTPMEGMEEMERGQ